MKISMTEQFADVRAMQADQADPSNDVATFMSRPGAFAGVVRRNRRRVGYVGVQLLPTTWRGTGEVCPQPATPTAIRKHALSMGPSTWSPPV